jgi:hypothetical protein
VDFKLTLSKRDKESHFILIKGAIHQEEITLINLYAPNVSEPNFIKHILKELKSHMGSNTVVVWDFNTGLSPIDRSFRQKKSKEILELNDHIDQMDWKMSTEHSTLQQQDILSSSAAHGTFSK